METKQRKDASRKKRPVVDNLIVIRLLFDRFQGKAPDWGSS
jgi:hypothetical protein